MTVWQRHEHIGDCDLYLGDCAQIMPALGRFDAVVTDPPYGIDFGKSGGFSASHGWGPWREKVEWDKHRPSAKVFKALMQLSDAQVIWGGNYFTDFLYPTMRWLIWDKGQRDFSLADFEMAWCSQQKAARIFQYSRAMALQDGKRHPTQKPVALMRWCLSFLPDAETILDPFMGSGTTGVACFQLGRKFTGIELDPDYFEIACKRIEAAVAEPRLELDEPPQKPEQLSLIESNEK